MDCQYCERELTEEELKTPTGQERYCYACASENMLMMGYTQAEAEEEYFGKGGDDVALDG